MLSAFDSFFNSSSHFVAHPVNANFPIRCLWTYIESLIYILKLLISHVSQRVQNLSPLVGKVQHRV